MYHIMRGEYEYLTIMLEVIAFKIYGFNFIFLMSLIKTTSTFAINHYFEMIY